MMRRQRWVDVVMNNEQLSDVFTVETEWTNNPHYLVGVNKNRMPVRPPIIATSHHLQFKVTF